VLFFDATHKDDSILNLNYDLSKLFESINLKELSTVMIPGNEAVKIANNFCKIISKNDKIVKENKSISPFSFWSSFVYYLFSKYAYLF